MKKLIDTRPPLTFSNVGRDRHNGPAELTRWAKQFLARPLPCEFIDIAYHAHRLLPGDEIPIPLPLHAHTPPFAVIACPPARLSHLPSYVYRLTPYV